MIEIQLTTDSDQEAEVINGVLAAADEDGEFDFAFNTEINDNVLTITVEDEGEKNSILECLEEAEQDGEIDFAFNTEIENVGLSSLSPKEIFD